MELGLMRGRRGLGRMIGRHQGKDAAVFRGSCEIGVPQHIAAAVDTGALAVPDRENAVEFAFAPHLGLLGAPDGRGREVLVRPGWKTMSFLDEELFARPSCRSRPPSGEPR